MNGNLANNNKDVKDEYMITYFIRTLKFEHVTPVWFR
jgi:hypothetical protein